MAEHKINGTDVLLFIGLDGITYETVVCLTSQTVSRTTNQIDAKSKCGPDKLPGTQDNNVSFEGQVMADPSSGRTSTDELDDHWREKTTIYWKVGKAVPTVGDVTYYGTGFISKLDEVFAQDAVATFSGEIAPYGTISKTTATS
jgi:predicted secreted protein